MTTKPKASGTKGQRTRQKIVETAAVLFNQRGFTGGYRCGFRPGERDALRPLLYKGRTGAPGVRLCVERHE